MTTTSPTYRLSDAQWDQIKDFLPANGHRGGQWHDHRLLIDGILWALSDGGRWRNLPAEFGPWQTVYDRFRKWCRSGLWDKILLHLQARKMNSEEIDWELLHRRLRYPGAPVRGRGGEKKIRRPVSRRTTPWAAARGASAPSCT